MANRGIKKAINIFLPETSNIKHIDTVWDKILKMFDELGYNYTSDRSLAMIMLKSVDARRTGIGVLCACGCGAYTKSVRYKFIVGHNRIKRRTE